MMTHKQFQSFADDFVGEMREIMVKKNPDYTVGGDAMSHYTEVSRLIGVPPRVVWAVLFSKHVMAILRYCRDGRVESEAIRQRFLDAANYCVLGSALVDSLEDEVDPPESDPAVRDKVQTLLESLVNYSQRIGTPTERDFAADLLAAVKDVADAMGMEVGFANARPEPLDYSSMPLKALAVVVQTEYMKIPVAVVNGFNKVADAVHVMRVDGYGAAADAVEAFLNRDENLTRSCKWRPFYDAVTTAAGGVWR